MRRLAAAFLLLAAPAWAQAAWGQAPPNTFLARVEALALLQTLNADLLGHDSATLALERWCGAHHLAPEPRIRAELVRGQDKAADATVRRDLAVAPEEPVRHRRVRLSCGGRVLSEADNWYVPSRLDAEMNRLLDDTDTPFGRAVLALGFARHTLSAELLWQPLPPGWELGAAPPDQPGTLPVPDEVLRHRAVLTRRDGTPFSEVVETYQRAMFDFPLPGG